MRFLLTVVLLVSATPFVDAGRSGNPLFDELIEKGLAIPGGPAVKFVAPLIPPGTAPKDPAAILEQAAGRVPVELFTKRTVTAPFSVNIDAIEGKDGERCAQSVNVFFVTYGKLDALDDTDFIKHLLSGKDKKGQGDSVALTDKELKSRGIARVSAQGLKEDYGTMTLHLLDKVQVTGVTRGVRAKTPNSILYAVKLDPRFQKDQQYPNQWRAITRNASDDEKIGPPHPYSGLAGYVQASELGDPKNALLIEMHFILHEPTEWFGGLNLLRSKLPIAIRDNVQSFRRRVSKNAGASPSR